MRRRLPATLTSIFCATMIPALAKSQVAAVLSPADRELVDVALSEPWLTAAGGVVMESTAPMCKPGMAFCIPAERLDSDTIKWDFPGSVQMRRAFVERNQHSLEIGPIDVKLPRVRRVQLEQMFGRGGTGWRALRQIHPDAHSIVHVSAPAYSSDGVHALLYLYSTCYGRCGGGSLRLYERAAGRWKPSRYLFTVIH